MRYILLSLVILIFSTNSFAFESASPLTDREIIEALTELKAEHSGLDKRFDDIKGLLYCILAGIFVLIGFVLWDRRTTLAPAAKKYDALERALIDYSDKHPDLKEALRHVGLL